MPPDPTPPPLPLAANRAALSNKISLLLASQSSVLKTMNLTRPSHPPTKRRIINDNDDDLLRGAKPNEGVGYVPEKKELKLGNSKEDRMLRGRLMREAKERQKWKEESESEEDVGRSALGKRKRPRREGNTHEVGVKDGTADTDAADVTMSNDVQDSGTQIKEGEVDDAVIAAKNDILVNQAGEDKTNIQDKGTKKKRKRKNKNKKKVTASQDHD